MWGGPGVDAGGEAARVPRAQGALVKLLVGEDSALLTLSVSGRGAKPVPVSAATLRLPPAPRRLDGRGGRTPRSR
jgi:hypothetical protein